MARDATTVLITGAAGKVGRIIRSELSQLYELRLLDVSPIPDAANALVGDVNDEHVLDQAMADVDAVIHLAANARVHADFDNLLDANIKGTYHVYEAVRHNGVKRVVLAGSNHSVEYHSPLLQLPNWKETERFPISLPLTIDSPARPDSLYGVSKIFGEALARYYADAFRVSSVCLRLGS